MVGDGKKPKKTEAPEAREAPTTPGDRLIHVPALIADLFDYPRSSARMMMALGNVTLNGQKLDIDYMDIPEEKLSGGVLRLGKHTAILTSRPGDVLESGPMDDEMVMGGM